jgi:hypothetical protein
MLPPRTDSPQPFDLADIVQSQVQILQVLHMMEVLHFLDNVILKVEDFEFSAGCAEDLGRSSGLIGCSSQETTFRDLHRYTHIIDGFKLLLVKA